MVQKAIVIASKGSKIIFCNGTRFFVLLKLFFKDFRGCKASGTPTNFGTYIFTRNFISVKAPSSHFISEKIQIFGRGCELLKIVSTKTLYIFLKYWRCTRFFGIDL